MRIDLNAKVRTSDGHEAGNIHRVLVDPQTERITGLVVSTRRLLGRDVIISEETLRSGTPDGDTIVVNMAKRELDSQPTFEETEYVVPPPGWTGATLGYTVPPAMYLWPADRADGDATAPARPGIKKGDAVKDRDGDAVGSVEDIRFDEATGQVLGVIVTVGAGLERIFGGGKLLEISRDDILRIADGEVRLGVDREEIAPKEHETGTR